jgi:ribosomal-protein-alanine N-acetyltransferase
MSSAQIVPELEHAGFQILPMCEHDLLEVVEIEQVCGLSLWGWDAYHAELSRPEAITLVARAEGALEAGRVVAGFIAARVTAAELHVNNIGVREEVRRRGLGAVLLGRALEIGARLGAEGAVLEVRKGNLAAQGLYGHFGFRPVGERRNYYRDPSEDALVMMLTLDRAS